MNCDPLARWYRWLEYAGFGRALERRREHFLPDLRDVRRALVLGDGDGRFLAAFLRANPTVEVDAVDNSARMLALAERRVGGNSARVRFHHADAREWSPPHADYDLIVTHFFLDCFTDAELVPLVARLASGAPDRARWVVSEFRQPAGGFAAWRARCWIGGLYAFFRVMTGLRVRRLPDHGAVLQAHGFERERTVNSDLGLLTSELWRRP